MNRVRENNPISGLPIRTARKTKYLSNSNRPSIKAHQSDVIDAAISQRETSSHLIDEKIIQVVKAKSLSNSSQLVKQFRKTSYQFSK